MLSHAYNIVIDNGVGAPGYGKYVVDGLNATGCFFYNFYDNFATYWCSH